MQKVRQLKETILLSPVQLIWLHSHLEFKDIEQRTKNGLNQIKFYKNNKGVEIRYQNAAPEPDLSVIKNARKAIQDLISNNQIRLLEASFTKELYIKIAKQARKEFDNSYLVFLHYQTFENCCKKLKDKFGITSTCTQLEKLQAENRHFCFLICQKQKSEQILEFTQKLLNLDVSCASTTFTRKVDKSQLARLTFGRRSHSVKSLKGSFTSGGDELQQRFSLNNSESDQQIYEITHYAIQRISKQTLDKVQQISSYMGRKVVTQKYRYSNYVECKRRLYHTNRLQQLQNPHVRRVYAYNTYQNPITTEWKLSLVVQKSVRTLRQQNSSLNTIHHWKRKLTLLYRLGCTIQSLHSSMQSQSQLNPDNIYIDCQGRVVLSGTSMKEVPPHTCPFQHDNRLFFCVIYWSLSGVWLSYQSLLNKIDKEQLMFTMAGQARNKGLLQFMNLCNSQFGKEIDLSRFVNGMRMIIDKCT